MGAWLGVVYAMNIPKDLQKLQIKNWFKAYAQP